MFIFSKEADGRIGQGYLTAKTCITIINVKMNVAMLMWLEPDNNVGIMAAVYQCGHA